MCVGVVGYHKTGEKRRCSCITCQPDNWVNTTFICQELAAKREQENRAVWCWEAPNQKGETR